MYRIEGVALRSRNLARRVGPLLGGLVVVALAGCDDAPTAVDRADLAGDVTTEASDAAAARSSSAFPNWTQGFNHDTEGWYGGETEGELGWCGTVERHDRGSGNVTPSAGRGYATVSQGPCNAFWAGQFGPDLVNAPGAYGPDFSNFSEEWPTAGFVQELDVYLDPDWEANPPPPPSVNFFAPPGTVLTYAATVRELSADPFVFHYFGVPVLPGGDGLSILGHDVTEAGWYTFRHVFRDENGRLAVDFELAERRGGTLFSEPIATEFYTGVPTADLVPADLGSGYVWFAAIAHGLEVPIDEHRMRPGR